MRATEFLQKYRVLESTLEKKYADRKNAVSSPVLEYSRDPDSEPIRTDLNLLREVRNILSHNSDSDGDPVIEPSEELLERLENAIAYVTRMRRADQYGTEAANVLFAASNDLLLTIMRKMHELGFSQVPILQNNVICGVLTLRSVFDFLAENGLDAINGSTHIQDLQAYTRLKRPNGESFMFVPADTDINTIRKLFNRRKERNHRLNLILVTEHGLPTEPLIRLLTPWDAMIDAQITEGEAANDRKN